MNTLKATIKDIENVENLYIVKFEFYNQTLTMMSLEVQGLTIGDKVILGVKPSAVAIGKDFVGEISYSNILKGKISKLKNGKLLSYVNVDVKDSKMQSIITSLSSKRLKLSVDDEISLFIKASDLFILEICDD